MKHLQSMFQKNMATKVAIEILNLKLYTWTVELHTFFLVMEFPSEDMMRRSLQTCFAKSTHVIKTTHLTQESPTTHLPKSPQTKKAVHIFLNLHSFPPIFVCCPPFQACIELPRLKLTLLPSTKGLEVKDSGGWFVPWLFQPLRWLVLDRKKFWGRNCQWKDWKDRCIFCCMYFL